MRKLSTKRSTKAVNEAASAPVAPVATDNVAANLEANAAHDAGLADAAANGVDIDAPVEAVAVEAVAAPTQYRGITRDATGLVRRATNYDQFSSRDDAYLAFFGSVARANNGTATLVQLHEAGVARSGEKAAKRFNPHYSGSAKATDVGAFNRLAKAGYVRISDDGRTITATELATKAKAYNAIKLD